MGTSRGPRPRRPLMPLERSWSMVPRVSPTVAMRDEMAWLGSTVCTQARVIGKRDAPRL